MIDQRIKLRHLRAFLEVARQKSVGAAANILHVSQPAVTKTIRELEDALGAPLFDREGRRIRITRHGEMVAQRAQPTLKIGDDRAVTHAVDSHALGEAFQLILGDRAESTGAQFLRHRARRAR